MNQSYMRDDQNTRFQNGKQLQKYKITNYLKKKKMVQGILALKQSTKQLHIPDILLQNNAH